MANSSSFKKTAHVMTVCFSLTLALASLSGHQSFAQDMDTLDGKCIVIVVQCYKDKSRPCEVSDPMPDTDCDGYEDGYNPPDPLG